MAVIIFGLCCLLTFVHAQEIHTGSCPDISTQPDFDLEKYAGLWNNIENTFFVGTVDKTCVSAVYTLRSDGKVDVLNEDLTSEMHEENTTGVAYYTDANVKSKLLVQLQASKPANYWVIETDYDNYSLVWSCENLVSGLAHGDIAWILGRKKTLDKSIVEKLKQRLQAAGIATAGFRPVAQENCPW